MLEPLILNKAHAAAALLLLLALGDVGILVTGFQLEVLRMSSARLESAASYTGVFLGVAAEAIQD